MSGGLSLGIISHQPVAREMAGPAIRCLEMGRALSDVADVTLFAPAGSDLELPDINLKAYTGATLIEAVSGCDVLLLQGYFLSSYPELKSLGKKLIIDLYVPMLTEALVQNEDMERLRQEEEFGHVLLTVIDQLTVGDFFICASERQRDYWLGCLSAAGRINPAGYDSDRTQRSLIDVVSFGLADEPPHPSGKALKGVHPGIGEDDRLLIWGGGIYNWLDPLTPIRAVGLLSDRRDDIRLFFMGTRHPDPHVPKMRIYDEAVALSRELGLLDKHVFFNDRWVRYEDRGAYLSEADIGVSANIDHIETRFAFRTRILDYIWARLPMALSDGDCLSEQVSREGLGLVSASGDEAGLAENIELLLGDEQLRQRCRANLEQAAGKLSWSQVTLPVRRYLEGQGAEAYKAPVVQGMAQYQQVELDQKQQDVNRLLAVVEKRDGDIEDIWRLVAEKDERIEDFQAMVSEKDGHIENFQAMTAALQEELEQIKRRSIIARAYLFGRRVKRAVRRRLPGGTGGSPRP